MYNSPTEITKPHPSTPHARKRENIVCNTLSFPGAPRPFPLAIRPCPAIIRKWANPFSEDEVDMDEVFRLMGLEWKKERDEIKKMGMFNQEH